MIHCIIAYLSGFGNTWCTTIYASNKLVQRKLLWNDIDKLQQNVQDRWFLMGDFNNVLNTKNIIGGNDFNE